MAVKPGSSTANGLIIVPMDGGTTAGTTAGGGGFQHPYGTLLLGAGQFSSSISPSGSGKLPVVRAFPKFKAPKEAVVTGDTFVVGGYLYAGTGANVGKWTITAPTATAAVVGICTHAYSTAEPWVGVASLV